MVGISAPCVSLPLLIPRSAQGVTRWDGELFLMSMEVQLSGRLNCDK